MTVEAIAKTESRRVLLVDDEPDFTSLLKTFLVARQTGGWVVHTAEEYSSALACLSKNKVDLVVLDLTLPVMDGLQFLKMLKQSHPELPVVILTGEANPEKRDYALKNGAALFLDKASVADGFDSIYPALEAIASTPAGGFRGMLRQVEIPDILQLECLGRKSSVLEITGAKGGGRIFIQEGTIIHAESGSALGEPALFELLGLSGGEFHLKPYRDPGRVTIQGNWESLLMEAARLRDEAVGAAAEQAAKPASETEPGSEPGKEPAAETDRTFEEIVLCSGTSELLYEWQAEDIDRRIRFLELLAKRSELFGRILPLGQSDRLEIDGKNSRVIALLHSERRVLVRIGLNGGEPDESDTSFHHG